MIFQWALDHSTGDFFYIHNSFKGTEKNFRGMTVTYLALGMSDLQCVEDKNYSSHVS